MKVTFFCLGNILGQNLTLDQLKRRGLAPPNRCYLCKIEEEPTDH